MAQAAIGGGISDDELIPEHGVIVNQAVMTAIEKKETELAMDIQINLVGAAVKVKGNDEAESALNIHDLTFSNGAELISGYVKATESVNVVAKQKMLVKSGVNLELALSQKTQDVFNSLEVENGATVEATTSATVGNLLNKGTFSIAADKTIASTTVENRGTATVEGTWNVSKELTNAAYANLTNKGVMTLAGEATNNGTLENRKDINVHGAMTNNSNVTIAANAKIHVNSSATASLLNNGTIINNGMLYTKVGYNNTITNLGTVDSKAGSTTYITKNSKADETTTATNAGAQIMGTLKIAERNLDITVTENNHQGYIEYAPVAADIVDGVFTAIESGDDTQDKYNKVVFSSAVKLIDADRVKYIVTSKNLNLVDASVNEVTFTGDATLYTQGATIASLTIEDDVLVKVPTINKVYVKTIKSPSLTNVAIHNEGELLVGGDLYTTILSKEYTTGGGEFSAGDGNASAFHWNMDNAAGKYQAEGTTAFVISQEGLNEALTADGITTVVLNAGEYNMPVLTKAVTIECGKGTVFEGTSSLNVAGSTIIGAEFSGTAGGNSGTVTQSVNGTFKDCTFKGVNALRYCYAGETVVFENCTFDGSVYGVHFDGGANDVLFKGCTFSGFNAMAGAVTLLTFDDCTFKGDGKGSYNGINLWGSTNLIDCEFTFDGSTGTEWVDCIGADKTYTFQNCTVNGVDYTSSNYKQFEKILSRNNVTVTVNGEECKL